MSGDGRLSRPRTVVVDDHPVTANAIAQHLQDGAGVEIVGVAYNADSGCKMALLVRPDLLLLDVAMPGRCSFDVCREVVAKTAGRTKVLLYASGFRESYLDRALDSGASGIACKATETVDELRAVIRSILRGGQYVSPQWQQRLAMLRSGGEPDRSAQLTPREVTILTRLAEGKTAADLANDFGITTSAIYHTIKRCREKLDCPTNERLMVVAVREGIVPLAEKPGRTIVNNTPPGNERPPETC